MVSEELLGNQMTDCMHSRRGRTTHVLVHVSRRVLFCTSCIYSTTEACCHHIQKTWHISIQHTLLKQTGLVSCTYSLVQQISQNTLSLSYLQGKSSQEKFCVWLWIENCSDHPGMRFSLLLWYFSLASLYCCCHIIAMLCLSPYLWYSTNSSLSYWNSTRTHGRSITQSCQYLQASRTHVQITD